VAVFVYLRFRLAGDADTEDFERDLRTMQELAATQPGYGWSEIARSTRDERVYVVLSEWDDIQHVRGWEHDGAHVEVQHRWEPHFEQPLVHRRFTPWERPAAT
jgi:heme-degrading monooxygenase HmoA